SMVDHGVLLRSSLLWASGFIRFGDPHPAPAPADPAGAPAQQRAELTGGEVGARDWSERHPRDLDLAGAGAGGAHAGRAAGWRVVRVVLGISGMVRLLHGGRLTPRRTG